MLETRQVWTADLRRTRPIVDFFQWQDHDAYQRAVQQLLRDLKAASG